MKRLSRSFAHGSSVVGKVRFIGGLSGLECGWVGVCGGGGGCRV